jgi:hypothetical protein
MCDEALADRSSGSPQNLLVGPAQDLELDIGQAARLGDVDEPGPLLLGPLERGGSIVVKRARKTSIVPSGASTLARKPASHSRLPAARPSSRATQPITVAG